jgi:uncharacterized membrane protein
MVKKQKKSAKARVERCGMIALETVIALGVLMAILLTAYGIAVKASTALYQVISTMNGSPYL